MKIENIELSKITKTDVETKEDTKTIYVATFSNEEIKVNISQEEVFDLAIGQKYSIKIETEQKKL